MNEIIKKLLSHRSIRCYSDKSVTDNDLDLIVKAVQAAPNWVNIQLVSIIAIKNKERKKGLLNSAEIKNISKKLLFFLFFVLIIIVLHLLVKFII